VELDAEHRMAKVSHEACLAFSSRRLEGKLVSDVVDLDNYLPLLPALPESAAEWAFIFDLPRPRPVRIVKKRKFGCGSSPYVSLSRTSPLDETPFLVRFQEMETLSCTVRSKEIIPCSCDSHCCRSTWTRTRPGDSGRTSTKETLCDILHKPRW